MQTGVLRENCTTGVLLIVHLDSRCIIHLGRGVYLGSLWEVEGVIIKIN